MLWTRSTRGRLTNASVRPGPCHGPGCSLAAAASGSMTPIRRWRTMRLASSMARAAWQPTGRAKHDHHARHHHHRDLERYEVLPDRQRSRPTPVDCRAGKTMTRASAPRSATMILLRFNDFKFSEAGTDEHRVPRRSLALGLDQPGIGLRFRSWASWESKPRSARAAASHAGRT
jgi:hypothetical protein